MKLIIKLIIGLGIVVGLLGLMAFGLYQYNDGHISRIMLQCNLSGGQLTESSSGNTGTSCGTKRRTSGEIYNDVFGDNPVGYTQAFTTSCNCGANRCWDNNLDKCVDTQ